MLKQRWREIHREAEEGSQEFPKKGGQRRMNVCGMRPKKKRHDRGYRKKQRQQKVAHERSKGGTRAGEIFIKGCAAMGGDVERRGEVGGDGRRW